ncbi:hypothetical protein [Clostridium uliginosum]|uniref:hypothetical protein n=1 Tax=Clostridium uliginosum TaxID=119641 RepID=UPI000B7E108E|nr:hypothetical protein [Clostridium uliginosum]
MCSVASEDLNVGVSSIEVVPFLACPELASGTSRNGATSIVRNPHSNPQQPKQTPPFYFG